MIILAIALYLLLFAALAGLVIFAPARAAVARSAGRMVADLFSLTRSGYTRVLVRPAGRLRSGLVRLIHWLAAYRQAVAIVLLATVMPSILVAWLLDRPVFDFDDTGDMPDRKIAMLLAGERLSAPPPLAPEVFTTREVELARPATAWASRDWALLDDDFRQRLLSVFKLMREMHGYDMVILEGYRSPERQAALAALGASVTQAGPGMSYHQHGLAADSAFLRDGQLVISEKDAWAMRGYALYGDLAEQMGLTWGGNWRMRDLGHVELRRPGVLKHVDLR